MKLTTVLAGIALFLVVVFPMHLNGATSSKPQVVMIFEDGKGYTFSQADREAITQISREAVHDIASILPSLPDRVEIVVSVDDPDGVIPGLGYGAIALSPVRVGWFVDPAFGAGVEETARNGLRRALFHEVHHIVRGWTLEEGSAGTRMIDAAVAEGLATVFERRSAPAVKDLPWGQYDPETAPALVEEIRKIPDQDEYGTWMFEHPDGRIYIGYRAGTFVVDEAIRKTGSSAADLVKTPTDRILEMAGLGGSEPAR